jgi:hypothetical protein
MRFVTKRKITIAKNAANPNARQNTDITYASFIGVMHLGCLLAPFTFTWWGCMQVPSS